MRTQLKDPLNRSLQYYCDVGRVWGAGPSSSGRPESCSCFRLSVILLKLTHRKFFRNLIKLNRNHIVFTIFRLVWNQTDVRLVPNQSENGIHNMISGWLNKARSIGHIWCWLSTWSYCHKIINYNAILSSFFGLIWNVFKPKIVKIITYNVN